MTIHYTLVFVLLMLEMAVFTILLVPMPASFRRAVTRWITHSWLVSKIQYYLKIIFVFVLVLFLDSINRAFRSDDKEVAASNPNSDVHFHMKVFRAQRNMYLTGFTVFLSLLLNRFVNMVIELSQMEEKLVVIKKQANQNKEFLNENEGDKEERIQKLEKELALAKKEAKKAEGLVSQSKNLSEEYNRLAEKYHELEKDRMAGEHKKIR